MEIDINMIKKILHRLSRIVTGHKGVYGKIGNSNTFARHVSIHEKATIGSYNYIGEGTMIFNAYIGNYNSIAPGVKIGQLEHDLNCVSTSTRIFGPSHGITNFTGIVEPAIIENDVWIGANAIILQGVKVENGSVIAAGAVVNKDVPPYAIVGGVPAHIIKYRMSGEQQDIILKSKWWEKDQEESVILCKSLQQKIKQL